MMMVMMVMMMNGYDNADDDDGDDAIGDGRTVLDESQGSVASHVESRGAGLKQAGASSYRKHALSQNAGQHALVPSDSGSRAVSTETSPLLDLLDLAPLLEENQRALCSRGLLREKLLKRIEAVSRHRTLAQDPEEVEFPITIGAARSMRVAWTVTICLIRLFQPMAEALP
jgi:hypothetical protein